MSPFPPSFVSPNGSGGGGGTPPDGDTIDEIGGVLTADGENIAYSLGRARLLTPDVVFGEDRIIGYRPARTLTCTLTSGSATVTTTSTAGLVAGQTVSGTGIPTDTVIASVGSATSLTLSAAATASGSQSLTFGDLVVVEQLLTAAVALANGGLMPASATTGFTVTGNGASGNTVTGHTVTLGGAPSGTAYANIDVGTNATAAWTNSTGGSRLVRWRAVPNDDPFAAQFANATGSWTVAGDNLCRTLRLWARHSSAGVGGLTSWTLRAAVGGNLWPVNSAIGSLGGPLSFAHPAEIVSPVLTVAAGAEARLEIKGTRMHGSETGTPAGSNTYYYLPGWSFFLDVLGAP